MSNAAEFARELKEFTEKTVPEEVVGEERRLATETVKSLIEIAPVWTGAYIRSIRVGINAEDLSFTQLSSGDEKSLTEIPKIPKEIVVAEAMPALMGKIQSIKYGDMVYVTNNVPHATNVEYGWPPPIGKPGYFPFTKTEVKLGAV